MPRIRTLIAFFLLSLLIFVVHGFPAAPLMARLDGLMLDGRPLRVEQVSGRIWAGQARLRWQQLSGRVSWETAWQGLRPGARVRWQGMDSEVTGWLGGSPASLQVRDLRLNLALEPWTRSLPAGHMNGIVLGQIDRLLWQPDDARLEARGRLHYGGGPVRWEDGEAEMPPLVGTLDGATGETRLTVVEEATGVVVARAEAREGQGSLQVLRAWARLLGVSQGGSDDDVVFQVSQPLGG